MFKAYFLMKPGADPFRYKAAEAADAVRAAFPDNKGYVQTRALPLPDSSEQALPAFSGSAELWFDNPVSAVEACASGCATLLADGAEVQSGLAGMERVVVRSAAYIGADRVKGVYPFRKRPDLTLEAFQHHWWHNHGPIAALTEEALSYIQIHPLPDSYTRLDPVYDGITEISWFDEEAATRAVSSRQMREDQGTDAPRFVDMESISLFMAKEEIVIEP